jgi:hypothetical protein
VGPGTRARTETDIEQTKYAASKVFEASRAIVIQNPLSGMGVDTSDSCGRRLVRPATRVRGQGDAGTIPEADIGRLLAGDEFAVAGRVRFRRDRVSDQISIFSAISIASSTSIPR